MIDLKQELQNYPPISVDILTQGGAELPDNIKNSIILYNKALESLNSSSEDIAIIELKKAISMNPNFYKAMNLLGLCYSYVNDNAKAEEIFEKVIAAENNSVKAMKYLSLINAPQTPDTVSRKKRGNTAAGDETGGSAANPAKPPGRSSGKGSRKRHNLLKYAAGFVAGIVLTGLIALYTLDFGDNIISNTPGENTGDTVKTDGTAVKAYEEKIRELNGNLDALQKELDASNSERDYYRTSMKLYDVSGLVMEKKYEEAADMLILLKNTEFKGTDRTKFDNLYKEAVPNAALAVLKEGSRLLGLEQYQEALVKLNKVPVYGSEWGFMDQVLYYIGKCYMGINNTGSALDTFKKLINDYPDSGYVKYANYRINELSR